MRACAAGCDWPRALSLFRDMTQAGIKPDVVSCTALMKALASTGEADKAEAVLQWMLREGMAPNVSVGQGLGGLGGGYSRCYGRARTHCKCAIRPGVPVVLQWMLPEGMVPNVSVVQGLGRLRDGRRGDPGSGGRLQNDSRPALPLEPRPPVSIHIHFSWMATLEYVAVTLVPEHQPAIITLIAGPHSASLTAHQPLTTPCTPCNATGECLHCADDCHGQRQAVGACGGAAVQDAAARVGSGAGEAALRGAT